MLLPQADWEQFLQPQPFPVAQISRWVGHAVAPEPEVPAVHFVIADHKPYDGGIDLWENDRHEIESANFYFAIGPIYTDAQVAKARQTTTPFTLEDVLKTYGPPAEKKQRAREEAERWTYHFQGDAKRTLTFTALAGSRCLHSVFADRE